MKRIELNTGSIEKGFWDGEKFVYTMKSKLEPLKYSFADDKFMVQLEKAKEFLKQISDSPQNIEIWNTLTNQEFFLFEKENVDYILNSSEAEEFLIYLETDHQNLFICNKGFRNLTVPQEEYPEAGERKKFTKYNLKDGYLSAISEFETHSESKGAIKLHILPIKKRP